jgi:hypothetical protein
MVFSSKSCFVDLYIYEFLDSNFDRETEYSDTGFMPFASVIQDKWHGHELK